MLQQLLLTICTPLWVLLWHEIKTITFSSCLIEEVIDMTQWILDLTFSITNHFLFYSYWEKESRSAYRNKISQDD